METSYLDFRGETAPAFQRFWEHFRMTPRSILDLASTNARVEQVEYRARTLAAFITAAREGVQEQNRRLASLPRELALYQLQRVPGIGAYKAKAILDSYGSLDAVRNASVSDLAARVDGLGVILAERVKEHLSSL